MLSNLTNSYFFQHFPLHGTGRCQALGDGRGYAGLDRFGNVSCGIEAWYRGALPGVGGDVPALGEAGPELLCETLQHLGIGLVAVHHEEPVVELSLVADAVVVGCQCVLGAVVTQLNLTPLAAIAHESGPAREGGPGAHRDPVVSLG